MARIPWPRNMLSANVSVLYQSVALLDRAATAAEDGFEWMESWWPFAPDETPPPQRVNAFANSVERSGLRLAALNFSSGDRARQERGLPALASGRDRLCQHVPIALDLAERLGCRLMNLQYGRRDYQVSLADQHRRAADAVAFIAEAAAERGIEVMIEPLCEAAAPDYLLRTVADVMAVASAVREIGGVDIGICFDVYHLYPAEPSLVVAARSAINFIRHVQVADWPDRRPPGTGEIDIAAVLGGIRGAGYRGRVGLEYVPDVLASDSKATHH